MDTQMEQKIKRDWIQTQVFMREMGLGLVYLVREKMCDKDFSCMKE